jgi:hypothetical protein
LYGKWKIEMPSVNHLHTRIHLKHKTWLSTQDVSLQKLTISYRKQYWWFAHYSKRGPATYLGLPRLSYAYLGYYVALKPRLFTPGPIQGISSRGGCYLAVRSLPLNITYRYFILREWVHQDNGHGRGAIDLVYRGGPLLGHQQACKDQRRYRRV